MRGPIHNHEVAPQIEFEQARQLTSGLRCLASTLNVLTTAATLHLEAQAKTVKPATNEIPSTLEAIKAALASEATALNALAGRVNTLTDEIRKGQGTSTSPGVPPPTSAGRGSGLSTDLRADFDGLLRAMQEHEKHLATLSYTFSFVSAGRSDHSGDPAAPSPNGPGSSSAPTHPLRADEPVSERYGKRADADTAFAIITVPDPGVPRHRRAYDLAIAALTQGMIRADFVLDDFKFPWDTADLIGAQVAANDCDEKQPKFGLIIFRKDTWRRGTDKTAIAVRALYVVPERATYGVDDCAFGQAVHRIRGQQQSATGQVLVFGPAFSGSVDSLLNAAVKPRAAPPPAADSSPTLIDAISASATVSNNQAIGSPVRYKTLAVSDDIKMNALADLATALHLDSRQIAVVYESTVFGLEASRACTKSGVCDGAKQFDRIPVPVNIADVRYGIAEAATQHSSKPPLDLPVLEQHLALDEGAENGSEYPIEKSFLTPASNELALNATLEAVRAAHYRIVAVIATDVRDRLFLFDRLRAMLPSAQFVDLATDRLLSHPDFVHASRGIVTLGSSELDSCGQRQEPQDQLNELDKAKTRAQHATTSCAATTDYQAVLARNITEWAAAAPAAYKTDSATSPSKVVWHLVARTGLLSANSDPVATQKDQAIEHRSGVAILVIALLVVGVGWVTALARGSPVKTLRLKTARPHIGWSGTTCIIAASLFLGMVTAVRTGGIFLPLATVLVIGLPWFSWRYVAGFAWYAVLAWLCLAAATLLAVLFGVSLAAHPNYSSDTQPLQGVLDQLALMWESGMAYHTGICIALIALLVLFTLNICATRISRKHYNLFEPIPGEPESTQYIWAIEAHTLTLAGYWILVTSILVAMEMWHLSLHGTRLTLFGAAADVTAFLALLIITVLGLLFLVTAVGRAFGILRLSCLILSATKRKPPSGLSDTAVATPDTTSPLAFSADYTKRPDFFPTPILSSPRAGGPYINRMRESRNRQWRKDLIPLLSPGAFTDDTRLALFALLAGEVCLVQNAILCVTITTLAATGLAFVFPITDGDGLLLTNLATLTLTGLFSGFITMRFETDEVLSRILCDRSEKAQFSLPLFGYVAFPFTVLAIAIAIADIPGVLNWSGSIFGALLDFVKPSAIH